MKRIEGINYRTYSISDVLKFSGVVVGFFVSLTDTSQAGRAFSARTPNLSASADLHAFAARTSA